jgi:hypothetical protein
VLIGYFDGNVSRYTSYFLNCLKYSHIGDDLAPNGQNERQMAFRRKPFFFEKKNQKTFAPRSARVTAALVTAKKQSFFAAFCSQKDALPSFSGTSIASP